MIGPSLTHPDGIDRRFLLVALTTGPGGGLPDTKVGTFDQALLDEATARSWTVVSMKHDWKRIFAFE
jgi:hypothetical protein